MIYVFLMVIGIAAGVWLERSGQRVSVFRQLAIYGALFVAGMLIEAAASGALIESVLTPSDLPVDHLVSLPLAVVLVAWISFLIGILAGAAGVLFYRQLRHSPA